MSVKYLHSSGISFTAVDTGSAPRNYSRTGYGRKLPTQYMVRANNRHYRVYAICYSNAASCYILVKGEMYFLSDYDII